MEFFFFTNPTISLWLFYFDQECVKKHALRSIVTARNITEEKGRQVIDSVFDKCYNDVAPFESQKLSEGDYYNKYIRMTKKPETLIPKFRFF